MTLLKPLGQGPGYLKAGTGETTTEQLRDFFASVGPEYLSEHDVDELADERGEARRASSHPIVNFHD